jgi:hypothetical protein
LGLEKSSHKEHIEHIDKQEKEGLFQIKDFLFVFYVAALFLFFFRLTPPATSSLS